MQEESLKTRLLRCVLRSRRAAVCRLHRPLTARLTTSPPAPGYLSPTPSYRTPGPSFIARRRKRGGRQSFLSSCWSPCSTVRSL